MAIFYSNHHWYAVECPRHIKDEARDYVNAVERQVPALLGVFSPLRPSFGWYTVSFNDCPDPSYAGGGHIIMSSRMEFDEDARHGGLFHETAHGFLEKYIHRPVEPKTNVHPSEAIAIILQVAALFAINPSWADVRAQGCGLKEEEKRRWLFDLVRIYKEEGFGPMRDVYDDMGRHTSAKFTRKETYIDELNHFWETKGWECRVNQANIEGLTDQ